MLRVRDIMTRTMLTLTPERTLREAMNLLVGNRVTVAPVMHRGRMVGVLSATDLLEFALSAASDINAAGDDDLVAADTRWALESAAGDGLDDHIVAEVMTRRLGIITPTASVQQAADYMRRAGLQRVIVMERGLLAGVLTAMDFTTAVAEQGLLTREREAGAVRVAIKT